MENVLPIRVRDEDGILALRDGLVFVLFLRKAHADICQSVAEVYEEYLTMVGESSLKWVHDRGEHFRPFTSRKKSRIRQLLTQEVAAKKQDELFTVKGGGGESEAAEYLFTYRGRDMQGRLKDVNASFVEMWFPTAFYEAAGLDAFVEGLLKMAEGVPFSSGYCSLGLNREDWAVVGTEAFVRAKAARHPGLDIHNTMSTAIRIGDRVRGAYWLTFLGKETLAVLEMDVSRVGRELGSEITVYDLRNGVAIRAGLEPEAGDVNRGENLPLIRKVAELIEPVQHIQTVSIFGFDEVDDFVNWQRRHLS
jgi:hypothetical protein